ncbi:MAG TPA: cation transporter [Gemmatimonadales bacterium]|nr:cation transporter [Gemmatimonadales bacterium]
MRTLTLHIDGMSCGHCLNAVSRALASLAGVTVDSVQIGRATVRYDESLIDPQTIETAVEQAGYPARVAA